ncbi:helix-turn-helix domain-containing protein [Entomohabitans teleogrylli]|uniref:helix-turn-helix domain-containing protein n=1 Tax=Entomohabitans teleogrylli TaxID=1384589 RepID=UPI00073D7457|nr:helix-turn-helix domain-containing protein [Entomohabitans teleogrylli]
MKRDSFSTSVVEQTLEWIEEHLCEKLTLDDLAKKTGYSKWHFQRLFHAQMSITAASYIRNARLLRSIHDLKYSSRSIVSIADKYGFSSQQSYTRTFKQVMRCTPSQCRIRKDPSFDNLDAKKICASCRACFQLPEPEGACDP